MHQGPTMSTQEAIERPDTSPQRHTRCIMLDLDDIANTYINTPVLRLRLVHHPICAETYMKAPTVQGWAIVQCLECRGYHGSNEWIWLYWWVVPRLCGVQSICVLRYSREHLGCGVHVWMQCMQVRVVSNPPARVHVPYLQTRYCELDD